MNRIIHLVVEDGIAFHKTKIMREDIEVNRYEVPCVVNFTWIASDYEVDGIGYLAVDHLAAAFKAMVLSSGVEQKDLAKMFDVTVQTVSRWCTGKSPVPEWAWTEVERVAKEKKK